MKTSSLLRFFFASVPGVATLFLSARPVAAESNPNTVVLHAETRDNSGAMLGGIGAGFVELQPDGCFYEWAINNRGSWAYTREWWEKNKFDRYPLPEMNGDSLQFFIRTKGTEGEPHLRRLNVCGDQTRVYSANSWLQNVASIDYTAIFPGATLVYNDDTLPVKVKGDFFSPIIPHDLQTSGTPGFYGIFTIKNTSNQPQEVSLAGFLRNPVALTLDPAYKGADARKLKTTVTTDGGVTYLTMGSDSTIPYKSTLGDITFSMSGGEPSYIASDFGEYLVGRTISPRGWWDRYESPMRGFRNTGRLPNAESQPCPNHLIPEKKEEIAKLTAAQMTSIIGQARKIPSLASLVSQAEVADPDLLDPARKAKEFMPVLSEAITQYAVPDRKAYGWGDGMLASSIKLQPGEEKQIKVILSWNFPNHTSPKGERNMGHMYSKWFKDSQDSNRFLSRNYDDISRRVHVFTDLLGNNDLPPELNFAVSAQMYTMVGMSWWSASNKLGVWEGYGSCGLNTMDVSYEASHPLLWLFPEWQKNWMKYVSDDRDPSGRLYHTLPSDLDNGPKGAGWGYVDVNSAFVMQAIRDYLGTGDKEHLQAIWPGVNKSMGVFLSMDTDGDGLPDKNTAANWYDTFTMKGTPANLSDVWIAMLRGCIRAAEDLGDKERAASYAETLKKAQASFESKLWNGKYYSLWVDGNVRNEACMSDQLNGEFYSRLIGLGTALPEDRIKQVMTTILGYNFTPDTGLLNGTYPPDTKPMLPVYGNIQLDGIWSGFEYATAANLIDQGMVDQGMAIIHAVHQRYIRGGRPFNHFECGDHYWRSMSIWAVLEAMTGFRVDAPRGILTLAPRQQLETIRAPWVSTTGLGQFVHTNTSLTMDCRDGEMAFKELRLNVAPVATVELDGKALSFTSKSENGLTVLTFAQPVTLKSGQKLSVH